VNVRLAEVRLDGGARLPFSDEFGLRVINDESGQFIRSKSLSGDFGRDERHERESRDECRVQNGCFESVHGE
jgi:hypothetical protein